MSAAMDEGLCVLGGAGEMWAPERKPRRPELAVLAGVCRKCPARRACAEEALDDESGLIYGVIAGIWVPEQGAARQDAMDVLRIIAGQHPQGLAVPA